mmetsp:Transcript_34987/g.84513  ORF Transcript_34987/g.84513 Transcript_34987/m.84513 type:complete len:244 (+) Transcript_34987:279-1010(+)
MRAIVMEADVLLLEVSNSRLALHTLSYSSTGCTEADPRPSTHFMTRESTTTSTLSPGEQTHPAAGKGYVYSVCFRTRGVPGIRGSSDGTRSTACWGQHPLTSISVACGTWHTHPVLWPSCSSKTPVAADLSRDAPASRHTQAMATVDGATATFVSLGITAAAWATAARLAAAPEYVTTKLLPVMVATSTRATRSTTTPASASAGPEAAPRFTAKEPTCPSGREDMLNTRPVWVRSPNSPRDTR